MAPQVVEIEGQTETLTGSAEEQFEQWRALLAKVYFAESGKTEESW